MVGDAGAGGSVVLHSLQTLDEDYGDPEDYDFDEIDVETSPDYSPGASRK